MNIEDRIKESIPRVRIVDGDGSDVDLSSLNPLVTKDTYKETDLVAGVISAAGGLKWKGLDIYNDSAANEVTFTLKNGTTTVFSFTLAVKGESYSALTDEVFDPFDSITIAGTTPAVTIIVRS